MQFLQHSFPAAEASLLKYQTYGIYYSEHQEKELDIHLHNCCEVLLCLYGNHTFLIDGISYSAAPGDLFVVNQYEPHKIISDKDGNYAWISLLITPEYLHKISTDETDVAQCFYDRDTKSSHKLSLTNKDFAKLQQLLLIFRNDIGLGDDIIKNSSVSIFLALINQFYKAYSKTKNSEITENKTNHLTFDYIKAHIDEPLTLDVLAENAFVSVNQLCKVFKNSFDTTIAKYIVIKRVAEAKRLLNSGKSVAETALLCGFCDYANFIRVFKKNTGISPGKYSKL